MQPLIFAKPDRHVRLTRAGEAGQSLVEFALILPVLVLIVMGIVDLGRIFHTYEALANAAREGARYCALNPNASATNLRNRITGSGSGELDGKIAVATIAVNGTAGAACPAASSGADVTVTLTTNFSPLTPVIRAFGAGGTIPVITSSTMVMWTT